MKRLVFCFDGSWNKIDATHPTNVLLTAESVLPVAPDGTAQLIYYDEGVGTERGEKLRGGMFGRGLDKNLNDAYRFLVFNHTPGDEIYVFGFSRGAFTARSFTGLIANCGILRQSRINLVNEMMVLYRNRADTDQFRHDMMGYRAANGQDICVSEAEDEWRQRNLANYRPGQHRLLTIRYVGVWDTVGALGIPKSLVGSSPLNKKYEFHDCKLSAFVHSARHAVSIDERKVDFEPTLWTNLPELNRGRDTEPHAHDAPYQEKWFPGTHGGVGGGGEERGLSDFALDWIWDGARAAGLRFDIDEGSLPHILRPRETAAIPNIKPKKAFDPIGWFIELLPKQDRLPGPEELHQVSIPARRRWHRRPTELPEGAPGRPKPLVARLQDQLDAIVANELGLTGTLEPDTYRLHVLEPAEDLSSLALRYYHDESHWQRIFDANRDKLEHRGSIHAGQALRIPD